MIDVILGILLQPPVLYTIIGLIVVAVIGCILKAFWETLEPCLVGVLDFLALVFNFVKQVFTALWNCMQNTVYPIKEGIVGGYDSMDQGINRFKKKQAYTHIPTFKPEAYGRRGEAAA
mmetsp:Transcript_36959/g.73143  ORF Transcript_36959/g.73143 Transcript_36959/m.73143 type:complete len:118 (+) Transcript_36959:128-481(+)|eukprot:CAMPEP_0172678632 /NCGR_PEP_ID=MMETSP1074-20121228/15544_1 /TAXON_ID=2916 /ORGANISM="Ceratium fusus, Strain PA161109" /LENGTH=117 /DNA_ID=CAMNT_0013496711 /DNA_START=64 /DNA_END=417 /DNA_ORIENTATION=+